MASARFIEANIEKPACEYAKGRGWIYRKLKWIGRTGAPDGFFARDGVILFVEFKAPGELPRLKQKREIRKLRDHGVTVFVIDSLEAAYEIFK